MTRVEGVNPFARSTTTAQLDVPAPVPPSGALALALRALIALALVAGWVQLAHTPVQRPIEELFWGLGTGRVTSVTIEHPPSGSSGQFPVEWEGTGRPSFSSYQLQDDLDGGTSVVDERDRIFAEAERAGVAVVERGPQPVTGGIRWELAGIAAFACLFLLVAGPRPRLATKWAWFWLMVTTPPALLAFLLLEPTRWGRRGHQAAVTRVLTGGWALLVGFVLARLLGAIPWYGELFPPVGSR